MPDETSQRDLSIGAIKNIPKEDAHRRRPIAVAATSIVDAVPQGGGTYKSYQEVCI